MVIIAVPTYDEGGLNSDLHEHFGKCECFTFINTIEDRIIAVKVVPNISSMERGGLGIQAAQIVSNNQANEIIVRSLGHNAFDKLKSLDIKVFNAPDDKLTVKELINIYFEGKLKHFSSANVKAKHGNA